MKANRQKNQLRLIAGTWRGRKLPFAPVHGLRPTPDRVRETLFNWLSPVIRGSHCLDLFAGSGALGFEAASRGAASVTLVDNHAEVVRCLWQQIDLLGAPQVRVVQADSSLYLSGQSRSMDIVFLDPPYRENLLPGCIEQLESGGWLAEEAWVYIEAGQDAELELPGNWEMFRSTSAGQVTSYLIRRHAAV
ncbi:MAG: 16S rRNA (guanine(966)-N(2))-methyltransferase RsmD [Gammaproteobacteria bacterium]|nr:MAG: 16S rRNA (guanine(966)-N(2))-methyltransferase RsmD [Gammaproteobacteria bacterium]